MKHLSLSLLGCLLLSGCGVPQVRELTDAEKRALIQPFVESGEVTLADGPGPHKCTITGDSIKDCCSFKMVVEDLGDGRGRIKESGVECDKSCKATVSCPTTMDEIIGLQFSR